MHLVKFMANQAKMEEKHNDSEFHSIAKHTIKSNERLLKEHSIRTHISCMKNLNKVIKQVCMVTNLNCIHPKFVIELVRKFGSYSSHL